MGQCLVGILPWNNAHGVDRLWYDLRWSEMIYTENQDRWYLGSLDRRHHLALSSILPENFLLLSQTGNSKAHICRLSDPISRFHAARVSIRAGLTALAAWLELSAWICKWASCQRIDCDQLIGWSIGCVFVQLKYINCLLLAMPSDTMPSMSSSTGPAGSVIGLYPASENITYCATVFMKEKYIYETEKATPK